MRKPKPTAKEYGRIGGLTGGKIRAQNLTPEARKAIAKKAAEARWSRVDKQATQSNNA
jgi:hypothetical protein